ncbi:alpha-2B adrenergic receptor-like [Meles meles]|uniref:alpha-2B adrenergic receptor-like n=1 Tax=Meles meles TaxID=9662 RepID=UPI001E69C4C0|nr:alpha-2B adrenergic receptor-like [Meles meles]
MSSAPERPEAKSRLPEAASARVSESRREAAAPEGPGWTSLSACWSTVRDVASQHQFEDSESESKSASEEEGEEEEDEELEEEEPRGVFTHCELSGRQVICTSCWVCASPDWDEGERIFLGLAPGR